jgi:hypothetical protein
LWPEHLTLGVFPRACWFHGAGTAIERIAAGVEPLDALDTMLAKQGAHFRRGALVDVLVSDSIGATTALPWQDKLGSAVLVRAYARMLLESDGRLDNAVWTVDGGFRHFGSPGLGAALPDSWVSQLVQVLEKHGLRLRSAVPLSALAYWQFSKLNRRHQSVLLLDEGSRVTALLYRARRLHALDAEPVFAEANENIERLCRRLVALHGDVAEVWAWSIGSVEALTQAVSSCMPTANVNQLALSHWRRK